MKSFLFRLRERWERINSIPKGAKIADSAKITGSKISRQAEIGPRSKVFKALLNGKIIVGNDSAIWGPNTDLYARIHHISIGNFTSIARNVSIQEYNHKYNRLSTYYMSQNVFGEDASSDIYSNGAIIIKNDVWIGAHSVILSGVTIGNGAIIAANSVVTSDVPDYAIVGGSPARILKYRFSEEIIAALSRIAWWNWPIEKIKQNRNLFKKDDISIEDLLPYLND